MLVAVLGGHVSLGEASPCAWPLPMAGRAGGGLELPESCSAPASSRARVGCGQGWPCCTSMALPPALEAAQPPGPVPVSCHAPQFYWCCSSTLAPPRRAGSAAVGAVPISPILWRHGGGQPWLLPCCCLLGLDVTFGWCCEATRTVELFLCSSFSWGTNSIS